MDPIEALGLPDSRWVNVGGPVHYRMWDGPREGPTFVCVHGLGGSLLNWAPVAPGLARRGRVLALDLAGFGLTQPEERGTGVGSNRKLLDRFLRELDLPPVVLVGNSMGGMVSLIQAAHAPQSVKALVLVDAAFPRTRSMHGQFDPRIASIFALYNTRWLGEWLADLRRRRLGPEGLVRETLRVAAADPSSIDPLLVRAMIEQARTRQSLGYATRAFLDAARSIFRAQVAPGRYRSLVRSITRPALVMHGARDRLIPVGTAREAAANHPNWKLVVIDDLGHIPQMEAPGRWLAEVEQWLDEGRENDRAETG
ncbi:MAG: alpha/beta fold hydrolase [Actinomycetota bacterium]